MAKKNSNRYFVKITNTPTTVSVFPDREVCCRTNNNNDGWFNGYPFDTSNEGNTTSEVNYSAGVFLLQRYTISSLAYADRLVLTLTGLSSTNISNVCAWIFPSNTWSASAAFSDIYNDVVDVVGITPRSSQGTANNPLSNATAKPGSAGQSEIIISGTALDRVKQAAASGGTFSLLLTNKTLTSSSSVKLYSSNTAVANSIKPTIVANITSGAAWTDVTTLFDGVNILAFEGLGAHGKALNVYAEQWITGGTDFMITSNNGVIVRENVDIKVVFIVGQRYANATIDTQTVYDAFVDYMTNTDVWVKSAYTDKEVHCVCIDKFEPKTIKLKRGDNSYILGEIPLKCLERPSAST